MSESSKTPELMAAIAHVVDVARDYCRPFGNPPAIGAVRLSGDRPGVGVGASIAIYNEPDAAGGVSRYWTVLDRLRGQTFATYQSAEDAALYAAQAYLIRCVRPDLAARDILLSQKNL